MRLNNAYIADKDTPIKTLKKQDGFTLIEVLIALSIFAVGLLAIAAMQTTAIRMNSTGGKLTELSTVGIARLENLMSLPFSDPLLQVGTRPDPAAPAGYNVSLTVVNNPVANTRNIDMTIQRYGKTLRIRSIRCGSL